MPRVLTVTAVVVAGVAQAIVAQSVPTRASSALERSASATPVARFPDEDTPLSARVSSTARYGSGLEDDAPICAWSVLLGSEGRSIQHVALARSVLLRFGSGLDGDSPVCVPNTTPGTNGMRQAELAKSVWLRFGSGLENDAPTRGPSGFSRFGLEGFASKPAAPPRSPAYRFGSGLEADAPVPAPNRLLESGL